MSVALKSFVGFIKNKNRILYIIVALSYFIAISGCSINNNINYDTLDDVNNLKYDVTIYPLEIIDSNSRVIIDKEPQRVISLAPNITEIICSLGEIDRIVGRTMYCDYPKEVINIPSIGNIDQPDIESIVMAKPDIVFASDMLNDSVVNILNELNIKVIVMKAGNDFNNVYKNIYNISRILNCAKKAECIISGMREKQDSILERVNGKVRPKVYYVIGCGKNGDYTAGKDTFISQIIEMAGGDNIAKDVVGWKYSVEKIIENNPDIIICPKNSNISREIKGTSLYKELDAAKKGNVYQIDSDLLERQGPRLIDGLYEMARILHPKEFY